MVLPQKLSRRVGGVMGMPTITDLSFTARTAFVSRIEKVQTYQELEQRDKDLITRAERERKQMLAGKDVR